MAVEPMTPQALQALEDLGAALRELQDVATSNEAPAAVAAAAARALTAVTEQLRPFAADLASEDSFRRYVQTSGSHTLNPVLEIQRQEHGFIEMSARFGPFFRNAFGYVNGGAIALLFDTAIAHVAFEDGRPSYTANLTIDYRSPAPVNTPLVVTVRRDSIDGRKHRISAELVAGDQAVARAQSLLIELPSGD